MSYYVVGGVVLTAGVWWLYRHWSNSTVTMDLREFRITRLVPSSAKEELVRSAQLLLKSQWRGCIFIGGLYQGRQLIHFVALPTLGATHDPDWSRAIGHVAMYLDPLSVLPDVLIKRREYSSRSIRKTLERAGIDESLLDTPNHPTWKKRKMYYVRSLVVEKSHRGKGIGKALLAACVAESDRLGAGVITGECNPDLVPFYKKFGVEFIPYRPHKPKRKMKKILGNAIKSKKLKPKAGGEKKKAIKPKPNEQCIVGKSHSESKDGTAEVKTIEQSLESNGISDSKRKPEVINDEVKEEPISYYNLRMPITEELRGEMQRQLRGVLVAEEV